MDLPSFLAQYGPVANSVQQATGVPAVLMLAVAYKESAGDQFAPGSNNLFGIKAAAGQAGSTAATTECSGGSCYGTTGTFAVYPSTSDSFTAFADLISQSSIYRDAWEQYQSTQDPSQLAAGIAADGYATDPTYASTIQGLVSQIEAQGWPSAAAGPAGLLADVAALPATLAGDLSGDWTPLKIVGIGLAAAAVLLLG